MLRSLRLASLAVLVACGGFDSEETAGPPTENADGGPPGDGTTTPESRALTLVVGTLAVPDGSSAPLAVTVERKGSLAGTPVTLTVEGLGVELTTQQLTLTSENTGAFTVSATAGAPHGPRNGIKVVAKAAEVTAEANV